MNKKLLIFTFLIVFQLIAYGQEPELRTFHGRVAGIDVTYQLPEMLIQNVEYVGSYLYDNRNIPIPLTVVYRDNQLILTAKPEDNSETEIFTANVDLENPDGGLNIFRYIEGEWKKGERAENNFLITSHNFKDNHITCLEMHEIPNLVFTNHIDLGSGHGSPIEVDYNCKYDVRQNKSMQKLFDIANEIRGPHLYSCMGSGRYAMDRYSRWRLLTAAFSPELSLKDTHLQNRKNIIRNYLKDEWSKSGIYNRQMYNDLISEISSLRPLVTKYFEDRFPKNKEKVDLYTDNYFYLVVFHASGSLAYDWESHIEKDVLVRAVAARKPLIEINNLLNQGDVNKAFEHASYDIKVIKLLLDAGAEINSQNHFGKTSLYYAVQYNNTESAKYLIEQGADVNHKYFDAEKLYGFNTHSCRPIKHTERTPLMHAAQHSDLNTVKLLIENGADLAMKDEIGWTIIDYAKLNDNIDVLNYLSLLYDRLPEKIKNPPDLTEKELNEWIENRLELASEQMNKENYAEAYQTYREAFKKNSDSVPVLIGLSDSAFHLEKNQEALKYSIAAYESENASPDQKVESRLITYKACRKQEILRDQNHHSDQPFPAYNCTTSIDYLIEAAQINPSSVSQEDIKGWFNADVNTNRYCSLNTDNILSLHKGDRFYYVLSVKPVNPDVRAIITDRNSHKIETANSVFTKIDEIDFGDRTVSRFILEGARGAVKYKELYCSPETIYPLPESYDFIVIEAKDKSNVQLNLSFSSPKVIMLYGNVDWNIEHLNHNNIYLLVGGSLGDKEKKHSILNRKHFRYELMPNQYSPYFKNLNILNRFKILFGRELHTYFVLSGSGRFTLNDSDLNRVKSIVVDARSGKMEIKSSTGRYRLIVKSTRGTHTSTNNIYKWELIKFDGAEVTEIVYNPDETNITTSLDNTKLIEVDDIDKYFDNNKENFYYYPTLSNEPILRSREYFGAGHFKIYPKN